ncbi:MAG: 30S ribosomal protein S2, partial [bacterium]
IESEATRVDMPYVCERWLGGMLTNFSTIRKSLKTLFNFERLASDGTFEKISKKERLTIEKDRAKLDKVLGGIRDMRKLPGIVFIADIRKEHIAVAEARKLNIPIVAIVDTNTDPDIVDYPIPGNDDAFKSIGLITRAISEAVEEAAAVAQERGLFEKDKPVKSEDGDRSRDQQQRRRRPRKRPPRQQREGGAPGDRPESAKPTGDSSVKPAEVKTETKAQSEPAQDKPAKTETKSAEIKTETKPKGEPVKDKLAKAETKPSENTVKKEALPEKESE